MLAFRRRTRHESLEAFIPFELPARLRKQMNAGSVSPRHQHGVAGEALPGLHGAALNPAQGDGADPQTSFRAEHRRSLDYGDARRARSVGQGARSASPEVGDRGNGDSRRLEIEGRLICFIARGDDDGARSDAHAVSVQIRVGGAGQQDARPIVAWKYQRALDRSRGEHHRSRAHLPQALARLVFRRPRDMIV